MELHVRKGIKEYDIHIKFLDKKDKMKYVKISNIFKNELLIKLKKKILSYELAIGLFVKP